MPFWVCKDTLNVLLAIPWLFKEWQPDMSGWWGRRRRGRCSHQDEAIPEALNGQTHQWLPTTVISEGWGGQMQWVRTELKLVWNILSASWGVRGDSEKDGPNWWVTSWRHHPSHWLVSCAGPLHQIHPNPDLIQSVLFSWPIPKQRIHNSQQDSPMLHQSAQCALQTLWWG